MAQPVLTPTSTTSQSILSSSWPWASASAFSFPIGVYQTDSYFLSGASDQVGFTYKKLGGDVLDIEIKNEMVFTAYEEAVLEYSYLVNIHQAKNALPNMLGDTTGSFDHNGQMISGESLSGSNIALRYPRFEMPHARRVGKGLGREAAVGSDVRHYTASFNVTASVQDYDLQSIVSSSHPELNILSRKFYIKEVYYRTSRSQWRFFSYYGALNVVGNLMDYGQYSDASTYEVVPVWQNKLQAMQFEDSLYTRISHYSYDILNNRIRLFPTPQGGVPARFWIRFYIHQDAWDEETDRTDGAQGINNINTLPFANIPYININAIGKQWIRRYALALSKEMLGHVRSKLATIPFPEAVTLDGPALKAEAKEEKEALRNELKEILDQLTYNKITEDQAALVKNTETVSNGVPMPFFVG